MAHEGLSELEAWLDQGYDAAFRTACLILGNRADAEEAVQEAYLRAWRFRDSLTGGDPRPWLYRVVVNACNSKLRDEIPHRDRRTSSSALDQLSAEAVDPERAVVRGDVAAALLDLPAPLRTLVVLRYFADLPERDIARAVGRPSGTVKSGLHEARRRLAAHPALREDRELAAQKGTR